MTSKVSCVKQFLPHGSVFSSIKMNSRLPCCRVQWEYGKAKENKQKPRYTFTFCALCAACMHEHSSYLSLSTSALYHSMLLALSWTQAGLNKCWSGKILTTHAEMRQQRERQIGQGIRWKERSLTHRDGQRGRFADKERQRVDCPHCSSDSGGCH